MRKSTLDKCIKVKELISKGSNQKEACSQIKLSNATYRKWTRIPAKTARKQKSKLIVHELPQIKASTGQAFIMFGQPHELAEFARNFQ